MSSESAIVFGGSSGLGEATVRELAGAGHKVTIADLNAEKGDQLAAELGVGFVQCDVTDSDQVEAAIAKSREGLDVHGCSRLGSWARAEGTRDCHAPPAAPRP